METQTTYQQALSVLADKAKNDFSQFWKKLDLKKPQECKMALCEYVPTLIQKYELAASALAVSYFEIAVSEEYDSEFSGTVREATGEEKLRSSISYFCRHLFGE